MSVFQLLPAIEREKFLVELKEPDEQGRRLAPFVANPFQKMLDDAVSPTNRWHVILKCRQIGISTYVDYRLLAKCLLVEGTRAAIISHERAATTRLLRRVHMALDGLMEREAVIGGKRVETEYASKYEITFPHTHSSLYIGTAGQRAFSRGDSITDLHGSEVAFWPNAGELMTGVVGALTRTSEVFLESTANGMGGYFYDLVTKCAEKKGPGLLHFFPWHEFPEYELDPPDDVVWSAEELQLAARFDINQRKLAWRRDKLSKYEHCDLFYQEFPMTVEEAFIVAGACFFDKDALREAQKRVRPPLVKGEIVSVGARAAIRVLEDGPVEIFEHPRAGAPYLIAADCSEGVEAGDPMSAVVLNREKATESAWVTGHLDPNEAAKCLFALGQFYNWGWLAVEDNGPGLAVLLELQRLGYPRLYKRTDVMETGATPRLGWHTDARTRPLALGSLRSMLKTKTWGVASERMLKQCSTFCKQGDGGYRANSGSHDDDVMAAAIAAHLHQIIPLDPAPSESGYFQGIVGPSGQPIRRGHKTGY